MEKAKFDFLMKARQIAENKASGNDYERGRYDGIELVLAVLDSREPVYYPAPIVHNLNDMVNYIARDGNSYEAYIVGLSSDVNGFQYGNLNVRRRGAFDTDNVVMNVPYSEGHEPNTWHWPKKKANSAI